MNDDVKLSLDTVKQVLDDFSSLEGEVVELSGGEPLLYEGIYETTEYASRKGLEVHLFTCAFLPNSQVDLSRLDSVDRFYVNLQAPNKVIHDYLAHNPGSFDQAIGFIRKCKAAKKWVGTHFVPLAPNVDEIDEYLGLAKLLKLDNVSLLRFVEQGRGKKNTLALNDDEILQLLSTIEKHRECDALDFKIGCPMDFGFVYKKGRATVQCKSGISRCTVRPNGNVIPCPAFKDSTEYVAGNVNDSSLADIWRKSDIFKQLRNFQHTRLRGLCSDCSFLDVCRGKCHAQRWHHYGDLYRGPDPYCPLKLAKTYKGDSY